MIGKAEEPKVRTQADMWVDQIARAVAMGSNTIPDPLTFDTAEFHESILGNSQISLVSSTAELRGYDANTMIIVVSPENGSQSRARVDVLSNFDSKDFSRCMVFTVSKPDEITGTTDEADFDGVESTREELKLQLPEEPSED